MAKARALDRRRKSIRNIRKITRTMELIATARFKKAMDRAHAAIEISGKRGISAFRYRGVTPAEKYTRFEDKVTFAEVDELAARYLEAYSVGSLDRLDVAYMQFHSVSRQAAVVETLLPLGSL